MKNEELRIKAERKAPNVLIVDDDPSLRSLVRLVMEDEGCQCRDVNDGQIGP